MSEAVVPTVVALQTRGAGATWRIGGASYEAKAVVTSKPGVYRVTLGERVIEVLARVGGDGVLQLEAFDARSALVLPSPVRAVLSHGAERWLTFAGGVGSRVCTVSARRLEARKRGAPGVEAAAGEARIESPMPGKVTRLFVANGDLVKKGQTLMTLEAMKMEHGLKTTRDGVVRGIVVEVGQLVQAGVVLASVSPVAALDTLEIKPGTTP